MLSIFSRGTPPIFDYLLNNGVEQINESLITYVLTGEAILA